MKRAWPILLLIILTAIALRLPGFLSNYANIDENEYAIAAQKILAGGLPYKDVLIYQPPLIYYVYALGFYITGGTHIWSAEILAILFVVGTVIALYFLGSAASGGRRAGLAAAFAYAVFSTTFLPQDMLAANCEIFMMLPLTLSVLSLYHAEKTSGNLLYLTSGILAGLGILFKYQGGVVLAAECFYTLVLAALLSRSFSIKRNFVPTIALTAGALLPIALISFYLQRSGAIPYSLEALHYIFLYAKGPAQNDLLYLLMKFMVRTSLFALPGIVMWLGAAGIIWRYTKGIGQIDCSDINQRTIYLGILWFFASIVPIIVGGRIYFHYYFTLLPPAALLFSIWWDTTSERLSKVSKAAMIAWLIICTTGWTAFAIYLPYKKQGIKDNWTYAAEYLKKNSRAGDTLYVWGYCPQIYIQSGLASGTRFTTSDYLTGRSPMTAGLEYDPAGTEKPSSLKKLINDFRDVPAVVHFDTSSNIFPHAWKYLREDFERRLPTFIVDTSPSNYRRYGRYPIVNYPYLANILEKNYRLASSIEGFNIYRLR